MNSILDNVIQIGVQSLFGFANGGIAAHGKPMQTFARGGVSRTAAIFGEAGPEAAVPLPDGRSIPVKFVGAPGPVSSSVVQGRPSQVLLSLSPDLEARILQQAAGQTIQIAGAQIKANNKQLPNLVADHQMRAA